MLPKFPFELTVILGVRLARRAPAPKLPSLPPAPHITVTTGPLVGPGLAKTTPSNVVHLSARRKAVG